METRSKRKAGRVRTRMTNTDDLKKSGQMMVQTKRKTRAQTAPINCSGRRKRTASKTSPVRTKKGRKSKFRKIAVLQNNNVSNLQNESGSIPRKTPGRKKKPSPFAPSKNPLEIAGIIHSVMTFLPVQDIKICRQVNKEWNHVAVPFIRNLCQIPLGSRKIRWEGGLPVKTHANYLKAFRRCQSKIPFTALKIREYKGRAEPWAEDDLNCIFKSWGSNLKELTVDCGKGLDKSYLSAVNVSEILKPGQLTRVNIDGDLTSPSLIFSVETLINVKWLRLVGCNLHIPEGSTDKISPVNMEIRRCRIWFENKDSRRAINKFIDFSKMKTLIVIDAFKDYKNVPTTPVPTTPLKLDLLGNFELKYCFLGGVSLVNWSASNWTIRNVTLDRVEFSGVTDIHIYEFKVDDSLTSLSHIPGDVKKLSIEGTKFLTPAHLPNLQHLKFFPEVLDTLRCFRSCPSLLSLKLGGSYAPLTSISIDSFPNDLKKLHIQGQIKLIGTGTVNVETLILFYQSVEDAKQHLNVFKAQNIIWLLKETPVKKFEETVLQLIEKYDKSFAVGQFDWARKKFTNSPFSNFVNKRGDYYLFENKRGQAISEDQFYKMITR